MGAGDTEERMRKSWLAALAIVGVSSPALAADPNGDWLVATKTAVIRIAPCGDALCGNIAWTKGPAGNDQNNPDPAKRNRSVVGLTILHNMKPTGENRWEGEIYNAQDGKTYSGSIALAGANVLRIEGCVLGFLCGGQDWSRAKCDEAPPVTVGGRAPPASAPAPSTPTPAITSCRAAAP
jgi:uncharacterized protein (DUF2147 family)